jgi:hypothetical protein
MRIEEARWIEAAYAHCIQTSADEQGTPTAVNLGCGSRKSREVSKPFIHQNTIKPLLDRGWRVIHSDMQALDGVDMVGNLFDESFQELLAAQRPRLLLFCNVLEHLPVNLRAQVPIIFEKVLAPGGLAFITVPFSYPYHADPIDTMFRPSVADLKLLFDGFTPLRGQVIDSVSYGEEFYPSSFGRKFRKVLRLLFPFVRPKRWLSHAHRFAWLHRPYQHTCIVLMKNA